VDIVIHVTGAIDWTGWILAAILAPIAAVSFYGFLRMFRWMQRYKLYAILMRRNPQRTDAEIWKQING
jgi:hypothetical protein